MIASLSRAAQYRLQHLTGRNVAIIDGDPRFFARHTGRNHRIRLASAAEVEALRLLGADRAAPPGFRWYAAVRQVAPGARLRSFFLAPAGTDTDQPEAECWRVYRLVAGPEWIAVGDRVAACKRAAS